LSQPLLLLVPEPCCVWCGSVLLGVFVLTVVVVVVVMGLDMVVVVSSVAITKYKILIMK
jgi:hypothetical protein